MVYCDLHIHSAVSDGTDAPEALPRLARAAGLAAMALTDHDTTGGLAACAAAARKARIRFIPGIELSADPQLDRRTAPAQPEARGTLHILGLFIRPDALSLTTIEKRLVEAREQRNPQIIARLNALGVKIDYDEVIREAAGGIVGRPHIAQVLLRKGYVKSIHEAFARYIGQDGAAYTRKDRLSAAQAIEAIHHADGLAILAHPVQLGLTDADQLEHYVKRLVELGLDGIETRHSDHTPRQVEQYKDLARRFELLTSGGSDYHGRPDDPAAALGSQRVPLSVCEALEAAWRGDGPAAKPAQGTKAAKSAKSARSAK